MADITVEVWIYGLLWAKPWVGEPVEGNGRPVLGSSGVSNTKPIVVSTYCPSCGFQVGSFSVFVLRHRSIFGSGKDELQQIVHVIAINLVVGLLSRGIDNWGHLGGLLGGAAVSWFVGPAWRRESRLDDGRLIYADRAPILRLIGGRRTR